MTQSTVVPPEERPISGWQAIWQVLTDPRRTFDRLGSQPPIAAAYLFHMVVIALVFVLTIGSQMEVLDQAMSQAASNPNAQMPPEAMGIMRWIGLGTGAFFAVASPWLIGLIVTLIGLFVAQFSGGGLSFRSLFGMFGYAYIPSAVASVLGGVWLGATGQMLNLSLSVVAPPDTSPAVRALLGMINPFTIWYYVLLAIGFASLLRRPSARGWALPTALFLLSALFAMATAGLAPQPAQF